MREAIIVRDWRATSWRPSRTAAALVIVVAFLLAAALASVLQPTPTGETVPINAAIEAKWGIRPTLIAYTADGGLVDFRYIVLDPDKVAALMSDVQNLPVLRAEDSGTLVNSTAAMAGDRHTFAAGQTYFMLYRNASGAIRTGTPVTILFGDLKIEHVIAR
jgi:hypothetical protein